ncbi:dihydroneopterin aldolase [Neptunomonas phycophila]|uniref:dihydroneopterin aldolase n=1 Tax=Neptunomonas phycophila TaxID=1572645 RepID=UPI0026E1FD46|nr:dihydroneopterin aldolase [Neptunomonas phycophila]MDO6782531.1 dihydroneopterin aldolase [Neptunomonas phycophila]
MDIVFVEGLQIETVIGIYDWEREIRQRVVLDLELGTDIKLAAQTEEIDNTLNYKAVCDRLIEFVQESEFLLVETMAEEIASLLMREFSVSWLALKLAKPDAIPAAAAVGVKIERGECS